MLKYFKTLRNDRSVKKYNKAFFLFIAIVIISKEDWLGASFLVIFMQINHTFFHSPHKQNNRTHNYKGNLHWLAAFFFRRRQTRFINRHIISLIQQTQVRKPFKRRRCLAFFLKLKSYLNIISYSFLRTEVPKNAKS